MCQMKNSKLSCLCPWIECKINVIILDHLCPVTFFNSRYCNNDIKSHCTWQNKSSLSVTLSLLTSTDNINYNQTPLWSIPMAIKVNTVLLLWSLCSFYSVVTIMPFYLIGSKIFIWSTFVALYSQNRLSQVVKPPIFVIIRKGSYLSYFFSRKSHYCYILDIK